jgi:hypothetical protein
MQIKDIVASAFNGIGARVRRDVILYVVCAVGAVAAIGFAASASVLALEPHVGEIYARLILAGVFALVVVAGALALRFAGQPAAAARAQLNLHAQVNGSQRSAQFAQLAMIVEAVLLGYSMARRR